MKNLLIDTNIFLEILLDQEKKEECKYFLNNNINNLCISDFSSHSIGVILFRFRKAKIFEKFLNDILPRVSLVSLPKVAYKDIIALSKNYNLDFDDSYQGAIAKELDCRIMTMDQVFKKVGNDLDIEFL